jgi:GTP-dependent phosphoenolpyruvate carboxykinase
MANIIPDAFKLELLSGTHNFASGGNTFKIALYVTTLGPPYTTASTVYSTTNEVSSSGTNYAAGGNALDGQGVSVPGSNTATVDFDNEVFSNVTLTSLGAAIYNTSASNKLCLVIDFGGNKVATSGDFTIQFPADAATTAIIQVA